MTTGAWVCLLSPLAGAVLITLLGTSISRRTAAYLSTLSVFVAFGGAVVSFVEMWSRNADDRSELSTAYTWLAAGSFTVDLSLLVDPLSAVMMLIVSGVGGLIVAYSIGYMDGDDEERRYFAYMAFFVFAMLLLVEGGQLPAPARRLGVGRPRLVPADRLLARAAGGGRGGEGVRDERRGRRDDGAGALRDHLADGHARVRRLVRPRGELVEHDVNLVALGLLGGAVAKSAQIPLHTWLPDAMEGPTPVSALIHAATMVTAGVYLLVRTHAIFEAAPDVQMLAAILGTVTLLVAGLVALVQTDIKRVIAYSTMSQIGYMFLGAGVGAYAAAIFLLAMHAFFKALLFMGAGIVIHYLSGEQDMRKMGGLKDHLPKTWLAFLIGSLALVGVPIFAGFWAKDPIVAAALYDGGLSTALGIAAVVGAFLTASTRSGCSSSSGTASRRRRCVRRPSTHTRRTVSSGPRSAGRWPFSPSSPPSAASSRCRARGSSSATGSTPLPSRSSTRPRRSTG